MISHQAIYVLNLFICVVAMSPFGPQKSILLTDLAILDIINSCHTRPDSQRFVSIQSRKVLQLPPEQFIPFDK